MEEDGNRKLGFWAKAILLTLLMVAAFIISTLKKTPEVKTPEIFFLDVGQGDSELIQEGDFQILIDGGPDDKVLSELGEVMPLWDRKIDIIILTHPHSDHISGINSILDRYEIGQVYSTGVLDTTSQYLSFLNKMKDKNIPLSVPAIGQSITPFPDGELTFLWPGDQFVKKTISNLNNSSEIVKFCVQDKCALFLGDAEQEEQDAMLQYYQDKNITSQLQAEILKVAHHGSRNGADENLLKSVSPKEAVIEVGKDNKFGHPHEEEINLLEKYKVKCYRTDQSGRVHFAFDSKISDFVIMGQ
ncbi:MAG: MBL fold metallo-hydrolase [Candidatus Berkelbacteria bacterium]|nr:MBL fold metallo-hydrolase [Candidatus Berkelbacteria bacterium]